MFDGLLSADIFLSIPSENVKLAHNIKYIMFVDGRVHLIETQCGKNPIYEFIILKGYPKVEARCKECW